MRIISLLLVCLLVCGVCHAEEVIIDMDKIMIIESSGNTLAYNKRSGARGLYQITPIVVREFNSYNGTRYTNEDMFDPQKCGRVAYWYMNERITGLLRHYKVPDSIKARLWAYNAGIRAVILNNMPFETRLYIQKYERMS